MSGLVEWNLVVNKWLVLLSAWEILNPACFCRHQWASRTLEWEDAEWECADPVWPRYYEENAL